MQLSYDKDRSSIVHQLATQSLSATNLPDFDEYCRFVADQDDYLTRVVESVEGEV